MEFGPSEIISSLGVLVAIGAFGLSFKAYKNNAINTERVNELAEKGNSLAEEQVRLSHASVENVIKSSILVEEASLHDYFDKIKPLQLKKNDNALTGDDKYTLQVLESKRKSVFQRYINAYEDACAKYLDNKIDKKRFKKTYQIEIRNIVSGNSTREYFDSHSSSYQAIIKVYHEWEDKED